MVVLPRAVPDAIFLSTSQSPRASASDRGISRTKMRATRGMISDLARRQRIMDRRIGRKGRKKKLLRERANPGARCANKSASTRLQITKLRIDYSLVLVYLASACISRSGGTDLRNVDRPVVPQSSNFPRNLAPSSMSRFASSACASLNPLGEPRGVSAAGFAHILTGESRYSRLNG